LTLASLGIRAAYISKKLLSNAFIEIQKSTGFDDDGYLKQLAKEKAKVQEAISKKKKYYKK
jgi:hypothetical protein